MKIVLEQSNIKVKLVDEELDQLLHGKALTGSCQLSEENNILKWSVEAQFTSGVPDLSFDVSHLQIRLPRVELANLLEEEADCIAHVLHPSKHELHLCVEKMDNVSKPNNTLLEDAHPSALRNT